MRLGWQRLLDLLGCSEQRGPEPASEPVIRGVSLDSRSIEALTTEDPPVGILYIAVLGQHQDGHAYIPQAIRAGAVAVMGSQPEPPDCRVPYVQVADPRQALISLAREQRRLFSRPVIGVTGSCGKTTVKTMIHHLLEQKGPALMTPGNWNNEWGLPLTLCRLSQEHWAAVLEMGARHVGDIAYLSEMLKPDIGVITMITSAHIDIFGSLENIVRTKTELIHYLSPQGTFILNAEEPLEYQRLWRAEAGRRALLSFGIEGSGADVCVRQRHSDFKGHHFLLETPWGSAPVALSLPGVHQVRNAAGAAAAALVAGLSLEQVVAGLSSFQPLAQRGQPESLNTRLMVVDDVYNANMGSMRAAIESLALFPGQRLMVIGEMGELGRESAFWHREMGAAARAAGIEYCMAFGDHAQDVAAGFGSGSLVLDSHQAIAEAIWALSLQQPLCVWVKGSRSAGMEKVVQILKAYQQKDGGEKA